MTVVVCVADGSVEAVRAMVPGGVEVGQRVDAPVGADVVLVAANTTLPEGWLDRLAAAAQDDPTVATVSAACAGADGIPDVSPEQLARADAAFAAASPRLAPLVPAPRGPVVLVRAAALRLAGPHDDGFGARATALGFTHRLADDLLVAGPPPGDAPGLAAERTLRAAALPLRPLTITIDTRSLGPYTAGTQVHTFELTAALARTGRMDVRAVVAPDLPPETAAAFAALGVATIPYEEAAGGSEPSDVVHRPSQVSTVDDLRLLLPLGDRLVITQQDLLTYRISDYHAEPAHWERHRVATRESLGGADHVVFFSEHVLGEALAADLVSPARASVIPIGTDRGEPEVAVQPEGVDAGTPFLLCLGTDLRHKNRAFALDLLAELRERGWDGQLVLAGPEAEHGSSRGAEDAWRAAHPGAPVTRLGAVSEGERAWLLRHAAALAYPSVTEGFGLLPFETGRAGVPCLFAPQGPAAELLPPELAMLVPWDAAASAQRALPLLGDGPERARHVEGLAAAAAQYTWDACAAALLELYEAVAAAPPAAAGQAARRERALEHRLAETELLLHTDRARFASTINAIGGAGMALVGPDGVLDDTDRRALLAVLKRRAVGAPLRALLRALHAGGTRARRYRREP